MANANIRIDDKLKKEAETIFNELGLNPTSAITLFYKQVVRTYSIPFELKIDMPNKEIIDAINEVETKKSKTYISTKQLMDDLNK